MDINFLLKKIEYIILIIITFLCYYITIHYNNVDYTLYTNRYCISKI